MSLKLSTGLRNAMLGTSGLKGALENGVIYVYTGTQPASADSAVTGTLLGICTVDAGAFSFGNPANGLSFEDPVNGSISKSTLENWKFVGLANGTAGWFRFMGNAIDNLGVSTTLPRIDGAIGVSGSDLNMSNVAIVSGAPTTIDGFVLDLPAA